MTEIERHRLRVFEKKYLQRLFEYKINVMAGWRIEE
jgi:hypothetical protein